MKMWQLPVTAFLYFSVATVVAEAAALAAVWARGGLTEDRWIQILAVAHDVDVATMWRTLHDSADARETEQPSIEEVVTGRSRTNLDLDLREMATDKGWLNIRELDFLLEQERERYSQVKASFDQRLEQLRQGELDTSLQEVQRQLESIDPKLAKDQLLRILDDESIDPETSMHFIVTMFKRMPLDKRKKLLAQFKTDAQEMERLHEILRQIRLGVPEVTLIRDTRRRLEQLKREN